MATINQLALTGGAPVVDASAHRVWPEVTEADRRAVLSVLDRGTLCGANAPEITALEREWAEYVGVSHCLALNSGTAALHCCVAGVGLQPGDEVIVPAHTFIATPHAVAHHGAVPVFCDIDARTFNIDSSLVEERITERTKALMPVHLYGLPADMDELRAIAAEHGLELIEDAAQSHGATYKGRRTGGLARCGAFSLNATKNLSGGEGGLFVTDDEDVFAAGRRLSIFGEDVPPTGPGEFRSYVSYGLGWNYRNQELSSAFARSQLSRLDQYNATARENARVLVEGLTGIAGVEPPYVPEDRESVYHKFRVRLDAGLLGYDAGLPELRDRIVRALRAEGVDAVLWQAEPLPAFPAFRRQLAPWHPARESSPRPYDPQEYPVSSHVLDSSFILASERHPLFVQERALMEGYVDAVTKVFENLAQVLAGAFEPIRLR
jgi:perosamine synthetase